MSTVQRRFYYYKTGPKGTSFLDRLEKIQSLAVTVRGQFTHQGRQVLVEFSKSRPPYVTGYITLLRDNGLPSRGVRDSAVGMPLTLMPNEGLLEASHFVFLPSQRILVFEYNHYGPRTNLLSQMVNELFKQHFDPDADEVEFNYISRNDALERIRKSSGVISCEVEYSTESFASAQSDASIKGLFEQAQEFSNAQKIALVLKGDKKNPLMRGAAFIDRFLGGRDFDPENLSKLKTKIINERGGTEEVDLLHYWVVSDLSVISLNAHRQLDSDSVYENVIKDLQRRFPNG